MELSALVEITAGMPAEGLAQIRTLAGTSVRDLKFFANEGDVKGVLKTAVPIYVLPLGIENGSTFGVHLAPELRARGRAPIVTEVVPGDYLETAASLAPFVYAELLHAEARRNRTKKPVRGLDEAVAVASSAFGPGFYEIGRHTVHWEEEAANAVSSRFGGRSPSQYLDLAMQAGDDKQKLAIFDQGRAENPHWMSLHLRAFELRRSLGQDSEAAITARDALACYHHTASGLDLNEFYHEAGKILSRFPEVFSEHDQWQIRTREDNERLKRIANEYDHGDLEWGTKLLCDFCQDHSDYTSHPWLTMLRKHFEKLGWSWALALCDLRS